MLDCLIMGDSLAVGVGQIRKECVTYAKSGINSYDYVNRHVLHTNGSDKQAKTVIISLGSNDTNKIKLIVNIQKAFPLLAPGMPPTLTPNKLVRKLSGRKIAAINDKIYKFLFILSERELVNSSLIT